MTIAAQSVQILLVDDQRNGIQASPLQITDEQLLKHSGKRGWVWDDASGIQSKRTTQLRQERQDYRQIDSAVLQRNLARLDAAFAGFWKHQRGFPQYRKKANFLSFEYKPGRCQFTVYKTTAAGR